MCMVFGVMLGSGCVVLSCLLFLPFIINYSFQMSVCIGGRGCVCFWEVHVGACVYGCSCVGVGMCKCV